MIRAMAVNEITFLILVVVISLEIGALTAYLIENRKFSRLREKYQRTLVELDFERKAAVAREASFEETTDTVAAKSAGVTSVFFNGAQWDLPWLNKIFPGDERYPHKPDVVVNDFAEFWALVLACRRKEAVDDSRRGRRIHVESGDATRKL